MSSKDQTVCRRCSAYPGSVLRYSLRLGFRQSTRSTVYDFDSSVISRQILRLKPHGVTSFRHLGVFCQNSQQVPDTRSLSTSAYSVGSFSLQYLDELCAANACGRATVYALKTFLCRALCYCPTKQQSNRFEAHPSSNRVGRRWLLASRAITRVQYCLSARLAFGL